MKIPSLLACFCLLFAFLAACSSTRTVPASEVPIEIYRGMAAADLVAAVGEADSVETFETEAGEVEVLVYQKIKESVQMVLASTEYTPLPILPNNPGLSGFSTSTYESQTTRYSLETRILLVDSVVVAWKQHSDVRKD